MTAVQQSMPTTEVGVDGIETNLPEVFDSTKVLTALGLINVIENLGLPDKYSSHTLHYTIHVNPPYGLTDDADRRANVLSRLKAIVVLGRERGFDIKKRSGEHNYSVTLTLDNIVVTVYAPASLTCENIPVTDENGEPVMEEATVTTQTKVTRQKVERKCTPLLSAPDFDAL